MKKIHFFLTFFSKKHFKKKISILFLIYLEMYLPTKKTQNNDLFISPKRKKAVLEMALKSLILSKLNHQMSTS